MTNVLGLTDFVTVPQFLQVGHLQVGADDFRGEMQARLLLGVLHFFLVKRAGFMQDFIT